MMLSGSFRWLICQGQCNPSDTLVRYDALVKESATSKQIMGRSACAVTGLAEAVRSLAYTRHRLDSWKFATCTVCEHQRQCG